MTHASAEVKLVDKSTNTIGPSDSLERLDDKMLQDRNANL